MARKSKLARRDEGGRGRRVSCSWYSDAAANDENVMAVAAAIGGNIEENNMAIGADSECCYGFIDGVKVARVMVMGGEDRARYLADPCNCAKKRQPRHRAEIYPRGHEASPC